MATGDKASLKRSDLVAYVALFIGPISLAFILFVMMSPRN
jgi:hypothetical protein